MASLTSTAGTPTPTKSTQPRRAALADISNDSSPVVGLAGAVLKTPPPSSRKASSSAESLLREQAKSLLGSPAEEPRPAAEDAKGSSQVQVLAAADGPVGSLVAGDVVVEAVVSTVEGREGVEDAAAAVVVDLSDSSSVVTSEDGSCAGVISSGSGKSVDDDCSSMWSVQANASWPEGEAGSGDAGEDEVAGYDAGGEVYYEVEAEQDYEDEEEEEEDDYEEACECDGSADDLLDGLCEGMSRLRFAGKHTRFVYDSDGEVMEGDEEVMVEGAVSPNKVLLKGMPVPQGKHLRFSEDDEA